MEVITVRDARNRLAAMVATVQEGDYYVIGAEDGSQAVLISWDDYEALKAGVGNTAG